MSVKNWNRVQNAAALRVFYRCGEYVCLTLCVLLSHARNIGMKFVKFCYQFFMRCEELVPNLHCVTFMKCDI